MYFLLFNIADYEKYGGHDLISFCCPELIFKDGNIFWHKYL